MSDAAFQEILRAHIEQSSQQEAERWWALMTGRRPPFSGLIRLPTYDVLDAEIVLEDILDADHIG
jgi:hypothetical protein